jgi:hypothetical protein
VHITQRNSLLLRFFTLPFLLILVIALALGGQITHAEPPIGPVPSHEKSLLVPAVAADICPLVVTMLRRALPATLSQTQVGSRGGVILDENGYILAVV